MRLRVQPLLLPAGEPPELRAEQLPQLPVVVLRVDADDLALLDGDADAVHSGVLAVALDEAVHLDDCHGRSVPSEVVDAVVSRASAYCRRGRVDLLDGGQTGRGAGSPGGPT
ncbi:hypothetical protein [Micromonospora aurantiaca]|uniref:hypothetical protein n=1 Tax=Micromonospora aurantiaca (nom. illeg.) TaxID=47850 RepID=UPI0017866051|nr:hypothetical protein [Micromonospora aurantiaca]UFN96308.1 hypothetical protein LF814_09300 [Micromonospora aurantiaca]